MNIVRMLASTLALVSTLAVVPGVAMAAEGPRSPEPATMGRDRDHRDGRRDFDRDWRGYRPAWIGAGMRDDGVCRF
jgi:hypothetical protein